MALDRPEVAVFNGDSIVREALEVLLQSAGYRTRFLREAAGDELGELLAGSRLLLVAPDLSAGRRQALMDSLTSPSSAAKIPILELVSEGVEPSLQGARVVLWPCSIEQLRRAIAVALFAAE